MVWLQRPCQQFFLTGLSVLKKLEYKKKLPTGLFFKISEKLQMLLITAGTASVFKVTSSISQIQKKSKTYGTKYSRMDQVKFVEDSL